MQSLPDSLLCEILAKVPLSRAKVQATLVSTAFNTALHQPSAHRQAPWEVDEWLEDVPSLPIPALKLACHDAEHCPPMPNTVHTLHLRAGTRHMQQSFPSVKSLTWFLDEDDTPDQDAIASLFPGLRTLALEGTGDFGDYGYLEGPFATACKGLHHLKHLEELTYCGIMPIDISLPKGCVVRLSRVDSVSDGDPDDPDADHVNLPHSVTSAIIDLTYAVSRSLVTSVDLSCFAQFGSLQQLTILGFDEGRGHLGYDLVPWVVFNVDALPAAVTEVKIAAADGCVLTPSYMQTHATYVSRLETVTEHIDTLMGALVVSQKTPVQNPHPLLTVSGSRKAIAGSDAEIVASPGLLHPAC